MRLFAAVNFVLFVGETVEMWVVVSAVLGFLLFVFFLL